MLTIRSKYDHFQKHYLLNLYEEHGNIPPNHLKAIHLRMSFFRDHVLNRKATDYDTNVEKDWSYVARREYRWNVVCRALADGFAAGNLACVIRMFMAKKFVIWPFTPVFLVTYLYRQNDLFMFYNKKYFDMCNVGEQYWLGRERNKVLRECNRLLDVEDF